MIVIIGTIARSWNSRIEKAFSPKGELIRPELLRPGSTCAVDDSASGRPSARDAAGLNPSVRWLSAVRPSQVTTPYAMPHTKIQGRLHPKRPGKRSEPTGE